MANSDLSKSEDILVKVDQNNLIFIDPNSVQVDGEVQPRATNAENLVSYVNLEADLIPRTILNSANRGGGSLTSIAKGTLNLLSNNDGEYLDTGWTELYTNRPKTTINPDTGELVGEKNFDSSGQSFGMSSVSIEVKGTNFIPSVSIEFLDVRGKTLFESPQNSPYKAFFHQPWPIFYLTVKGYYGKAIRYRLHLTSFNTAYDDATGNFVVSTKFVGSTYAYLNDIPLTGILNAPYMFGVERSEKSGVNEKTGEYQVKLSKTSKGYLTLKSIYQELRRKKLIDFPPDVNPTLRELIVIAKRLDQLLENEIFSEVVDMRVFAAIKEFEENINKLYQSVKSWKGRYLAGDFFLNDETNDQNEVESIKYFQLIKTEDNKLENVTGTKSGTLEQIIKSGLEKIKKGQSFTKEMLRKDVNFNRSRISVNTTNPIQDIKNYVEQRSGKYGISINKLLTDILDINKSFLEEKKKFQDKVEEEMNKIISDPSKGIGFKPTIRNIFAVILANADVYIRLMRDVHFQAYNNREERKKRLKGFSDETPNDDAIYPWPEVKKETDGNAKVLAYPGDSELVGKLGSDDFSLWPEVGFVEEYIRTSMKINDTLAEKEKTFDSVSFTFADTNADEKLTSKIGTTNTIFDIPPYSDKNLPAVLYEIFERSQMVTLYDTFDTKTINELASIEFNNLQNSIEEDFFIVDILKERVNTNQILIDYLQGFSPFERYPYYKDSIPTTPYILDIDSVSFKIESNIGSTKKTQQSGLYPKLESNLKNYRSEEYRTKIYPFSSDTYLGYVNKQSLTVNDLSMDDYLSIDTTNGFVVTPMDPTNWVVTEHKENIFSRKFDIDGTNKLNILNTPYFHKMLNEDFLNSNTKGKYKGSSYLLLNSLPFHDLHDELNTGGVTMSNLFREVGATHFIPYHLMLKWGSMYHRYKTFILEGTDIISGMESPINSSDYYDGGQGLTYSGTTTGTPYVGIHPKYEQYFHQIVNDYTHFDGTPSSYESAITNLVLYRKHFDLGQLKYYTSFVDNSRFTFSDKRYTLLPSHGGLTVRNSYLTYNDSEQFNFRSVWESDTDEFVVTGKTRPTYNDYFEEMGSNNKKVIDLIGTFSPKILEEFEDLFLNFSSQKVSSYEDYKQYPNIKYDNFQDLLKDLVSVDKKDTDDLSYDKISSLVSKLQTRQIDKFKQVTEDVLSTKNLLKVTISNPKELNLSVLRGYYGDTDTFNYGSYNSSQLVDNQKYIELYVGETLDFNNYYGEFFAISDIEVSESNVLKFRSLIQIYAGYRKSGGTNTKSDFGDYIAQNIVGPSQSRQRQFMTVMIRRFPSLKRIKDQNNNLKTLGGFNDDPLKLETYNNFKLFNDRWTSGNSIGQRLLLEEFLFLDKANRDIGDTFFMDLKRLIGLGDTKNQSLELYGVISLLLARTNVDLRALPAYVNFYGNDSSSAKIKPSNTIANTMFGKFLDVDLEYSTPKMLLQYVGQTSKHLNLSTIDKEYKFLNDGFNMEDTTSNPLLITNPRYFESENLSKSNKVVAFEVSFGDQNQGIFKGISLDQSQFRNTFESNLAIERLARSEAGSGASQVDIGLFDIYRARSYECTVQSMGNVMIQPTMYFQLKNVPLFEGAYWIIEVTHNITNNTVSTSFKGVRIPKDSLPDPKESFTAMYRVLFDKIMNAATARGSVALTTTTEEIVRGGFVTDRGPEDYRIPGEELIDESGVTNLGVPYNGFNNVLGVQKVKYKGNIWYRSRVIQMGQEAPLSDDIVMSLPTKLSESVTVKPNQLKWGEIKNSNKYFFSVPLDFSVAKTTDYLMLNSTTQFLNPLKNLAKTVNADSQLNSDNGARYVNGPIDSGERVIQSIESGNSEYFGLTLSKNLMKDLKLVNGDVVYFTIE
jgi:hypothetical protein